MTKEDIEKILNAGTGRHLGDLCGWSLHGTHNREHVHTCAKEYGLDGDLDFPKVTPSSAYRRAVNNSVRTGRSDERDYAAVLLEDTPNSIVHAIVRGNIDDGAIGTISNKQAEFQMETRIGFDKRAYKNGDAVETLVQYEDANHPVSVRVAGLYEELAVVYQTNDIRTAFQRAFSKWGAMRLLEHGGLWWVPCEYAEKVREWKRFMVGICSTPIVIPIFDTEETIASLKAQSQSTLEGQLADLVEQLEGYTKKDNTRLSTLEKRVEMFDDLRSKIELHARVLGIKQQELLDKLDAAAKGLTESLLAIR